MAWLCGWLLAGCGGPVPAGPTGEAGPGQATSPQQDRFPAGRPLVPGDPANPSRPFAIADRKRVAVYESITRAGEPLALGSIEIPLGWLVDLPQTECLEWKECVLWRALSPDRTAEIALLAPLRMSEVPLPAGTASPQARIAASWLQHWTPARSGVEELGGGQVEAVMPATRKRWSSDGAWRWVSRSAGWEHEWLAVDVESAPGGRFRAAQSGPVLRIRMPPDQFNVEVADAVRASLRYQTDWFASWWLAWELRQVRLLCEGGFRDNTCRRQPSPYVDYFQSPASIGVWDLLAGSGFDPPDARYDR